MATAAKTYQLLTAGHLTPKGRNIHGTSIVLFCISFHLLIILMEVHGRGCGYGLLGGLLLFLAAHAGNLLLCVYLS